MSHWEISFPSLVKFHLLLALKPYHRVFYLFPIEAILISIAIDDYSERNGDFFRSGEQMYITNFLLFFSFLLIIYISYIS